MRISVNCSRKGLVALPSNRSSSSAVHRPSFGRGCTSRSYSAEVAPDRRTLRTVFRDTLRSRAISLIVLPLRKCSRRIRPIVSTVSIPPPPASNQSEQRIRPNGRGSILDADNPAQGVKIARRNTSLCLVACAIHFARRSLSLQRREEALHRGVVPDVARSAHRTDDAVLEYQTLELLTAVLGGFKRSSQRVVCLHIVLAYQALRLAFSSQVSCVASD